MTARPEPPREQPCLQWTLHPMARDPARTALLLLVIALTAALIWSLTRSGLLTLLSCVLLLSSLRAWFLPRTYVLDESGAREDGPLHATRRLLWSNVRRVSTDRHGVHLSPLHRTRAFLPDRGLFLRTAGNVDRVLDFVRARQGSA